MVNCKICDMNCGLAITNKHLHKYHNIDLIEYKKIYGDNICWNKGLTKSTSEKINSIFSDGSFGLKMTESNKKTWANPITRAKRINGIKKDYSIRDNSERCLNISISSKEAFKDPIKRENKLRHIKARKDNKEFGLSMSKIMNNAINNGFKPENNAYTIYSYDEELGHIIRSKWERNFARLLNHFHIEYEYEPKVFKLKDCFYTPDFYLPKFNWFIEISGVYSPRKVKKLGQMLELYPEVNLYKIDSFLYQMLEKNFKGLFERETFQVSEGGDV